MQLDTAPTRKGWLQVLIDTESHALVLDKTGELGTANFESLAKVATERQHCYFIMKEPLKQQKFFVVHWAPDAAAVRQRFLYASNIQKLQDHLGASDFSDDFHVSEFSELTTEYYTKKMVDDPTTDVRTWEEIKQEQTDLDTAPTSTKTSVMATLPIKTTDSFLSCIKEFTDENSTVMSLIMDLNDDQSVNAETGPQDLEGVKSKLDPEQQDSKEVKPKYVLLRYKHENREGEGSMANVFLYFCPEAAHYRLKFTYSTCKTNIICALKESVEITKSLEVPDIADLTTEKLLNDLYPVYEEKKEVIKAAGPKKRKGRSRRNFKNLKN